MFNYQPVIQSNLIYHRSGWKDVIDILTSLSTTEPVGLKMIDLVDNYYYNPKNNYINSPWIGFIHHVPDVPPSESPSLNDLLNNSKFKRDLFYCRGILTLSNYLKTYLESKLPRIKITNLFHPINKDVEQFDLELFKENKEKQLLFIGNQDRQYARFYRLKTNYQKIWLSGKPVEKSIELLKTQLSIDFNENICKEIKICSLSNSEYDNILKKNIVMLDLYNCSANNAIIECIVRNTPIFVNKKGGVVEYLGKDYPLYFNNLEELSSKLENIDLIMDAHFYLKSMDKQFLSFEYFTNQLKDIVNEIKVKVKVKPQSSINMITNTNKNININTSSNINLTLFQKKHVKTKSNIKNIQK